MQKWEISGKMRDESWRALGKVACLVNFYCKAVGGRTKIPQYAQEQRKKTQVEYRLLLALARPSTHTEKKGWEGNLHSFQTKMHLICVTKTYIPRR